MAIYFYYCPYCGQHLEEYETPCSKCNTSMKPVKSKYERSYYIDKAIEKYGNSLYWYECLLPEIKENPLFEEDKFNIKVDYDARYDKVINKVFNKEQNNVPKCPTCGSTNIKKISTTSKVVGAATFGLFSKTARSQFECKNCGYKW